MRTASGWRKCNLSDLGVVARGKSRHRPRNDAILFGGETPFFQTGDVKAAVLHLRDFKQTYSDLGVAQSRVWSKGTVCMTIAANIAESAVLDVEGCFPDSIVGITVDDACADRYFVKYLIDSLRISMQSVSAGTTQDNLSLEKLLSFEFPCPSLEEQRRIGRVLADFDEFIEVVLDQVAAWDEWGDHLFRLHFEEEPEGQSDIGGEPLLNWLDFKRGAEPGSRSYRTESANGSIPFFRVGDLGARIVEPEVYVDRSLVEGATATAEDVLVSFDGTPGRVRIGFEGAFSTGMRRVVAAGPEMPFAFVYFLMRSQGIQRTIAAHTTGVTIAHSSSAIPALTLPLGCTLGAIQQFASIVTPILKLRLTRDAQVRTVARLRNLALPRLVSGDLAISPHRHHSGVTQ